VFGCDGGFAGLKCQTLTCALKVMILQKNLTHNGPAIWGGCVTQRSIRAGSRYFSRKAVTVQGGYGALFAIRVQVLWAIRVLRYKFDRSREFIPRYKFGGGHWRSVAVQIISKPEICQGAGF